MIRCACGDPHVDDDGFCSDTCRLTFLRVNLVKLAEVVAKGPLVAVAARIVSEDILGLLEHVRGNG